MRIFSLQTEDEESKEGQSGQGTASQILESPGDVAEAWKIDFSADGNQLLTGQLNLHTLTMNTDEASGVTQLQKDAQLGEHQKLIYSMAYSRNGNLAAAGNIDGVVHLYDM